ncbi:MAG: inorganic triphosphatase [Sphingomonas bacterium]|nr:CHAD domain-containing protein [Sphingomonas bacterium]MDB5688313.1 inorganic triphosphatase [Sphingomonas bacterium]
MPAPLDMEVEFKLEASPADLDQLAASPLLAGVTLSRKQQVSTYFDAPGLPLRAAGLSLRVRQAGGSFVQTVKAEGAATAGLFARPEWECEIGGEQPVVDEAAGPLTTLLPATTLQALAPAFVVTVTRRTGLLQYHGASIELVLDVGEVSAGGRTDPVAELELELKSGPAEALFSLARAMNAVVPLRLGVLAKSERGYRLADGRTKNAAKARDTSLSGDLTTAEAFQRIAGACLRQFRLNEAILARNDAGAEALHQARVGLRRLRSALSIFRPVVGDMHFDHVRGELRWLAATLGDARDIDVLLGRGGDYDIHRLRAARSDAYAAVHAALASGRVRELMIDLSEWIAIGTWRKDPADPALPAQPAALFATETLDRLRRRLRRRGRRLAKLSDEERHEIRILAKKTRYAADFFAGLFPGEKRERRARRFLAALADLQEQLGELNDISHGDVVLARLGLDNIVPPQPAGRRKKLIAAAAEAHEAFADAKPFWR